MSTKSLNKKKRLANENRKIKRLPAFVIARTKRKVSYNKRSRNWRTSKLAIED